MSGIYIPGRLQETDPILFEALCLEMCLAHLGYNTGVECMSGTCRDPRTTVFPDHTKQGDVCLVLRIRGRVYDREMRVAAVTDSLMGEKGDAISEVGAPLIRDVECTFVVGPLKCTPAEFPKRWDEARSAFMAEPSADKFFRQSRSWKNIEGVAKALRLKGFEARR